MITEARKIKNKINKLKEDVANDIPEYYTNIIKKFLDELSKTIEAHRTTSPDSYDLQLITRDIRYLIINFKHKVKI